MLDHIGIEVTDYEASRAFYDAALGAIGLEVIKTFTTPQGRRMAGYGPAATRKTDDAMDPHLPGKPELWIAEDEVARVPFHFAFRVPTRALVDAFYEAALAAGGKDNGGPGIRAHYHPDYYGAFVIDPDGYNVEAVCLAAG